MLPRSRMLERKPIAMQRLPQQPKWTLFATVDVISRYGMLLTCQMNANLVGSAGLELNLHQRVLAVSCGDVPVRNGLSAARNNCHSLAIDTIDPVLVRLTCTPGPGIIWFSLAASETALPQSARISSPATGGLIGIAYL